MNEAFLHVSCVACCLSALFLCRELARGQTWNERRVLWNEGEAGEGLANLLVYGSTLLFQGQR